MNRVEDVTSMILVVGAHFLRPGSSARQSCLSNRGDGDDTKYNRQGLAEVRIHSEDIKILHRSKIFCPTSALKAKDQKPLNQISAQPFSKTLFLQSTGCFAYSAL
jgi:hypothetical protein